jgi:hypothetical protein
MTKKDKKAEGAVQNREIFQRMNFLYQAAMFMATITTPANPANITTKRSAWVTHTKCATADIKRISSADTTLPNSSGERDESSCLAKNKQSRARTRQQFRENKNRIAKDQISPNPSHHGLAGRNNKHNQRALSGVARFYAATLREVGRKNVIRMYGPFFYVLSPMTPC